eukprot:5203602-Prymnesium_polylepis.1
MRHASYTRRRGHPGTYMNNALFPGSRTAPATQDAKANVPHRGVCSRNAPSRAHSPHTHARARLLLE